MTRRHGRLVSVLEPLLLLGLVVLLVQSCSPFQRTARAPVPGAPAPGPAAFAGAETCRGCHADSTEKFEHTRMGRLFTKQARTEHERLSCEGCHGPGKAHAEAPGKGADAKLISFMKGDPTPVETRNAVCLTCHQKGDRLFWDSSPHAGRDLACTSCHTVMTDVSPRSQLAKPTQLETCGSCHVRQRAQQMRSSHMPLREGKMTCTSCHNPHGSVTPTLLREPSLNETCYTCHAEKRGPFLFEHAPVVESCANCHDPHGTNHEKMLKVAKPRLCQQCHIETRHPTSPYGRDAASLKFVMGRSCANCHVNIHGSNHPSGFSYTR
jgi:DmsE family decaheme c-type cytochrome